MSDFTIKRGDLLPDLAVTLLDADENLVDLTLATGAKLAVSLTGAEHTPIIYKDMVIADQVTQPGVVTYLWADDDTSTPGEYEAEVVVDWSGREQTFPTIGYITITIADDLESHVQQMQGFRAFSTVKQIPPPTTTSRLGA